MKKSLLFLLLALNSAILYSMEERSEVPIAASKQALPPESVNQALMWAALNGYEDIVRLLLEESGANVNFKDEFNRTPLMLAALNGHGNTIMILINEGADVNLQDSDGETAVVYAALNGQADIVNLLVKRANLSLPNKAGNSQFQSIMLYLKSPEALNKEIF